MDRSLGSPVAKVRVRTENAGGRQVRGVLSTAVAAVLLVGSACGTRVSREAGIEAPSTSAASVSPPQEEDTTGVHGQGSTQDFVGAKPNQAEVSAAPGGVVRQTAERPAGRGAGPATSTGGTAATPAAGTPGPAPARASTAPTRPDAAAPPATSVKALSPVKIGAVGPRSGPLGSAVLAMHEALQSWAKYVNATKGGVSGHPVELIAADDGADPARHRALVQDLVERRGVVAFVDNFHAVSGSGAVGYLTEKRIPVIGGELAGTGFYESPMYFPQAPTTDMLFTAYIHGTAPKLLAAGKGKVGILLCVEAPDCGAGGRVMERTAAEAGLTVAHRADASIAQPDYTAECLSARNAGVQTVLALYTPDAIARYASSCARQNYKPHFAMLPQPYSDRHLTDSNFDGSLVFGPVFPWAPDAPGAGPAEFRAVMARYRPGVPVQGMHAIGWVSAKLFERAAGALSEPATSASVLDGLWSIKNEDLGGITQPLTFTRDRPAPKVACWFMMQIRDKKLTALDGGQRGCL